MGGFGAFGKMPALGDFFRIGAGPEFVGPWDGWLQQGLAAARAALGGRWQGCYLSAPVWRFTLAPGLVGAAGMIGVMMASVDRVGRQFPLTLAAPLPGGWPALSAHFAAGACFAHLEGIALDALDEAMTREALAARLAGVGPPPAPGGSSIGRAPGTLVAVGAGAQGPLGDVAAALAAREFRRPSVWSADVAGGTRLMLCEGLPGARQMPGLFDLEAAVWAGGAP
jgi:type VI secretion system protein ImpM